MSISTKQKRGAKPVTSGCSRTIRLMNNQTKSQRKATIPTQEEKATTRMLWLPRKLYNNWVASRKTQIRCSQRGKQCKKSWNQLKGYNSPSLRYVKQVSRKRKDHRWEKYKSNILSPNAMKFNDQSHEETARQQRYIRSKAWNLAKNINKLKRERPRNILLARGRMGTPGCVNKTAGGKRVCGRFWSWYAYGRQRRP